MSVNPRASSTTHMLYMRRKSDELDSADVKLLSIIIIRQNPSLYDRLNSVAKFQGGRRREKNIIPGSGRDLWPRALKRAE